MGGSSNEHQARWCPCDYGLVAEIEQRSSRLEANLHAPCAWFRSWLFRLSQAGFDSAELATAPFMPSLSRTPIVRHMSTHPTLASSLPSLCRRLYCLPTLRLRGLGVVVSCVVAELLVLYSPSLPQLRKVSQSHATTPIDSTPFARPERQRSGRIEVPKQRHYNSRA